MPGAGEDGRGLHRLEDLGSHAADVLAGLAVGSRQEEWDALVVRRGDDLAVRANLVLGDAAEGPDEIRRVDAAR